MIVRRLSVKDLPEEDRPREKLIRHGEAKLSDAELLAIVLGSGTTEESAIQLAQRILRDAGDLKTLARMSVQELCQFHGIGPARATQLKAALELARRNAEPREKDSAKFSNSQMVYRHFHSYFQDRHQEEFWVVPLNAKNKILSKVHLTTGTLTGSLVHPREVFEVAIRNSAAGLIILHNHPSGEPEPSLEDRKVTEQMKEAGKVLGIPLLDHLIIGNGSYFSFKDEGLL